MKLIIMSKHKKILCIMSFNVNDQLIDSIVNMYDPLLISISY